MQRFLISLGFILMLVASVALVSNKQDISTSSLFLNGITHFESPYRYTRYTNEYGEGTLFQQHQDIARHNPSNGISFYRVRSIVEQHNQYLQSLGFHVYDEEPGIQIYKVRNLVSAYRNFEAAKREM